MGLSVVYPSPNGLSKITYSYEKDAMEVDNRGYRPIETITQKWQEQARISLPLIMICDFVLYNNVRG